MIGPVQECCGCGEFATELPEQLQVCEGRAFCAFCFNLADEFCDQCGDSRDPANDLRCQCRECEHHGWWRYTTKRAYGGWTSCPGCARERAEDGAFDEWKDRRYGL